MDDNTLILNEYKSVPIPKFIQQHLEPLSIDRLRELYTWCCDDTEKSVRFYLQYVVLNVLKRKHVLAWLSKKAGETNLDEFCRNVVVELITDYEWGFAYSKLLCDDLEKINRELCGDSHIFGLSKNKE